MMEYEKLPRYSTELIERLDVAITRPRLPMSEQGWMNVTQNEITRLAFRAGQRALVDELVTMMEEDEKDGRRSDSSGSTDSGVSGWDDVLSETGSVSAKED